MMPNGMHVIFLPFADDCRNLKFESGVEPTEEQVFFLFFFSFVLLFNLLFILFLFFLVD